MLRFHCFKQIRLKNEFHSVIGQTNSLDLPDRARIYVGILAGGSPPGRATSGHRSVCPSDGQIGTAGPGRRVTSLRSSKPPSSGVTSPCRVVPVAQQTRRLPGRKPRNTDLYKLRKSRYIIFKNFVLCEKLKKMKVKFAHNSMS